MGCIACNDWMAMRIPEAPTWGLRKNLAIVPPLIKLKNVTIYIAQGHSGRCIRMACDDWMAMRIPEAPTGASGKNAIAPPS